MYESGPPEQGTTFASRLRCEFHSAENPSEFIEVHATFESNAGAVASAVDELFESVVFATQEEHSGLDEVEGFEEVRERVGDWQRIGGSASHPSSQFQYVFEDANMYVLVKAQLQDRQPDADLREATFDLAQAAAETIREKSEYDFD